MEKFFKKRGQKLQRRVTRLAKDVSEDSIDHIKENLVDRVSHIRNVRLLVLEWSLLVVVMIFLSLTQAFWYSDSYASETYVPGGTYSEATLGKVNSLNPLFASTNSEKTLSRLLFATLTSVDYTGHTGLGLAESITMDETGKTWTLKLRDGLKWSDGEPLTNADVIFTVNLIQDTRTNTSYNNAMAGVSVAEDKAGNLVFSLDTPNVYFNSALDLPIVPKHILEKVESALLLEDTFSTAPTVTSGAFTYNAAQLVGTEGEKIIYLNPNSNYYKGKAMLGSFVVHAFLKTDDIVSALNTGMVSATAELRSSDESKITSGAITLRQTSLSYGVYAFFNMDSETLKSKPLRQAIRQGLNMTNLRNFLNGEVALDYPLIPSQIDIKKYPEIPQEDFIKARSAVMNIVGANPTETLQVVTVDSGYLSQIAQNMAEQLTDLGIPATAQVYEANQDFVLNVLRPRNYDIVIYPIGLGPDPDLMAYYHSTQATSSGYNLSNYRNSLVNDIMVSARTTVDQNLRSKKYESFLNTWVDDVPAIGIYQTALSYYVNKNVRTFSTENSLVYSTDRFNDVIYWAAEKATKNRTP
ncbi:MAG: ABC transporter substrate-binding protein [Candidatus Saccharibacteria bacterium]|nr:ABC transporter substrate-binding protein [Candidatus Saccharibacteria bacterium]